MTILIKAATGLLAGVVAGGLGWAFLPRVQPTGVTPRAAVGHPQFVAVATPDVAPSATTVAIAMAPPAKKPDPVAQAKPEAKPSPVASAPAAPVVAALEAPKSAPAAAPPHPAPAAQAPVTQAPVTQAPVTQAPAAVAPIATPSLQASSPPSGNEASARSSVQGLVALAKGDLSSARLYLTRAADAGDPRAWVALADTYDPQVLTKLGVVGAPGDAKRAKDYLQKAADAGVVVAKNRMAALESSAANVR